MCHLAAMQPCSMVALLLAVQIITMFNINTVSSCGPKPDNMGACNIHTRAECTEVCRRDFNGAGTCCEGTGDRGGAWTKYCREGECIRQFGA